MGPRGAPGGPQVSRAPGRSLDKCFNISFGVQALSRVCLCPIYVCGPWAMGDAALIPDFVQSLSMSKVCPISVQLNFFHSKAQNENPDHFFPSPKYVKYLSSVKKCNIFDFLGHSLDNLYICLSKCLGSGHILD